jgi:menaquinone-dependent protoporphyrinogen oxidase
MTHLIRLRSSWRPRPAESRDGARARVLVAYASRQGATREIAAALVRSLSCCAAAGRPGPTTVLAPVQHRPDPTGFDAVVLGSALYDGAWLEEARSYADAFAGHLRGRAAWLFSSGVLPADVEDAATVGRSIGARGHQFFAGDRRDWSDVQAWAAEIVAGLARIAAPGDVDGVRVEAPALVEPHRGGVVLLDVQQDLAQAPRP